LTCVGFLINLAFMPRLARAVAVGFAHHITQRGNNRQDVFFVDDNQRICHTVSSEEVFMLTGRIRLDKKPIKKHVTTPMAPYNKLLRSVASLT
jgi:hypothetical protein